VEEPSLYIPDGDGYVGTHLIQGGWNPDEASGSQHNHESGTRTTQIPRKRLLFFQEVATPEGKEANQGKRS
jgi:hypothetical protein